MYVCKIDRDFLAQPVQQQYNNNAVVVVDSRLRPWSGAASWWLGVVYATVLMAVLASGESINQSYILGVIQVIKLLQDPLKVGE